MKYFQDKWSKTVVSLPDDKEWDYKEMTLSPDYVEVTEKEVKEQKKTQEK